MGAHRHGQERALVLPWKMYKATIYIRFSYNVLVRTKAKIVATGVTGQVSPTQNIPEL